MDDNQRPVLCSLGPEDEDPGSPSSGFLASPSIPGSQVGQGTVSELTLQLGCPSDLQYDLDLEGLLSDPLLISHP